MEKALWLALSVSVLAGLAWPASFSCSFPYTLSGTSSMYIQSDAQVTPALSLPSGASACAGSEFSPGMSLSYGWHQAQYDAQLVSHATSSTCLTPYSAQPSDNAIHWLPASSFSKVDSSGGISFASMQDFQNYMAGLPTGAIAIASKYIDPFGNPFSGGQTYQSDVALYCKGTLYLVSDTPGYPYSAVVVQDYSSSGNGGPVAASYQKPVLPSNLGSVTFRLRLDVTGCSATGRTYTFRQTPSCQFSPDSTWVYGRCPAVSSGLSLYSAPLTVSIGTPFACADLPVSGQFVSNASPAPGSQVSFGFTLSNNLSKEIQVTAIALAQSSVSEGFGALSVSPVPSTIAAGQSRQFAGTVVVPSSAGTKALRLSITYQPTSADCGGNQPTCSMAETQILAINVTTVGPALLPDYVPVITAPQNATVGVPFSVSITTRNIGAGNATNSSTTRAMFESASSAFAVPPLASGQQQQNAAQFSCTSVGQKLLNATADYLSQVGESNEGNNFASATVNCLPSSPSLPGPATSCSLFGQTDFQQGDSGTFTAACFNATGGTVNCTALSWTTNVTGSAMAPPFTPAALSPSSVLAVSASAPPASGYSVRANSSSFSCTHAVNVVAPAGFSLACALVNHGPIFYANESAQVRADCLSNGQPTSCPALSWSTGITGASVSPAATAAGPTPQFSTFAAPAAQPPGVMSGSVTVSCASPQDCSASCSVQLEVSPTPDSMACALAVPRPGPPYQFLQTDSAAILADCTRNSVLVACPDLSWTTTISGGGLNPPSTARQVSPSSVFSTQGASPQAGTISAQSTEPSLPLSCSSPILINVVSAIGPDYVISEMRKPVDAIPIGGNFQVDAYVANTGNRNATDASITHFGSGCVPPDFSDSPIMVGESRLHSATCTCTRPGVMSITATADAFDTVDEINENNNARTVAVLCGNPAIPACFDYV